MSGTWTTLNHAAPGSVGTMLLLPNGSVMTTTDGDGAGSDWALLTPDSAGSYVNGTWSKLANSNDSRLFDSSVVMQNGNVFLAGGEYGSGGSTGEIYTPITNTWTRLPAQPYGAFIDSWASLVPNGNVLISPVAPSSSGYTTLFNPTTNTWSQGPKLARGGSADEQSWVKLADGSILTAGGGQTSERYVPSLNQFVADANLPVNLTDSLGEYGPAFLMANGNAFFIGASGASAIYTPSGTTAPGTWVAGPTIPGGLGEDDASGVTLRDGNILITAGPIDSYNGPTSQFLYSPTSNTFTAFSGPNSFGGAPFLTRMLALPNGDALYADNGSNLYQYDPGTTPLSAAIPTLSSIAHNADGTLTLTGTNFNGINQGASYGDDAQMDSNYPIVRLTSGTNVYYASSYSWSSTGVQLGSAIQTVNVTLPLGIPAGSYSLTVSANGVASLPTSLVVSTTSNNVAPTIATAASASTISAAGTSATLSVLGADDAGESNLTYTWINTSAPSGTSLASFSINGTNPAKTTTLSFHGAGTYLFDVTITDAGGLSVLSNTVSIVVSQILTSVSVAPTLSNLTVGQSKQLTASAYDQFGKSMSAAPTFAWAVTSGAGSVTGTGVYTTPGSGTLATVTATTGSLHATNTIAVVNQPWTSSDIGKVTTTGSAYDSGAVTTLTDTSDDIWNQSDDFHFDYQQFSGDMSITAKLVSQTSASNYIKAGLMIRNTLDATSAMAMVCDPGGPLFEWRTATSATAAQIATTGPAAPYWLRLVRSGNNFTAYSSTDGTTWNSIGTQTIAMNANVYVGLALTSHDSNDLATAVFSNVSVMPIAQTLTSIVVLPAVSNLTSGQSQQLTATAYDQNGNLMTPQPTFTWAVSSGAGTVSSSGNYTAPVNGTLATVTATANSLSASVTIGVVKAPWTSVDINRPGVAGIAYDSSTTTTINGSGSDIYGTSDQFHFDYQSISGDGSIVAEVNASPLLNTDGTSTANAKGGLMFRDSSAANGSFVSLVYDNSQGIQLLYRNGTATAAAQVGIDISVTGPIYLKLLRAGSTNTGYYSTNGTAWNLAASYVNTSVGTSALAGLVTCSHDNTELTTVTYSNVAISQPTIATAASVSPNPVTGKTASPKTSELPDSRMRLAIGAFEAWQCGLALF